MWERIIFGSLVGGICIVFNNRVRKNVMNILVTGGNRGIGLELVKKLSTMENVCIYLGSRNLKRGEEALKFIKNKSCVKVVQLDVTKLELSLFTSLPKRLFAIVHNAGTGFGVSMEETFAVNCFGPKKLDDLLLERIQPNGKLIYVTSPAGPKFVSQCKKKFQTILLKPKTWSELEELIDSTKISTDQFFEDDADYIFSPYHFSKAILNSYMLLMAKQKPQLKVNACVPGYIKTDLMKRYAKLRNKNVEEMGMKKPKDGIFSILKLIFEIDTTGGHYGADGVTRPMDFEVY